VHLPWTKGDTMKLPTGLEMKNLDHLASEHFGIPSIVLMENAGLGTVKMLEKELGPCKNTFALIFIGPGNNGGDGLVIGRHLHQRGCQPVFFFLVNPDSLKGDAAVNLHIVKKLRLPFHVVDNAARVETIAVFYKQLESRGLPCHVIIDAIFGIGLCREITDHFADTINLINTPGFGHNVPVVSVDTPSGMDADTGKILGTCVRANYTATYCCAKPGHFIHGSSSLTGKLEIIDIGIPPEAVDRADITTELATADTFTTLLQPLRREKASHKGSHGHLLILAGSAGKTGAAVLTAKGALRSGAGLVSLCVPHDLNAVFETTLIEAMTVPLPNSSQALSVADWDVISQHIAAKQAVVLGPGIGKDPDTAELVLKIYLTAQCPLILDADALTLLAGYRNELRSPAGPRIFTPHPGELARLLDKSADRIQDNRLEAARLGCDLFQNNLHDIVLILKGAGTIIAAKRGSAIINTTGNPGMATGGMGDVLSGVIGALVCQGLAPLDAAVAGVYLHGAAADRLYEKCGSGFLASEVADMIPYVVKEHLAAQ
jgi:ADP-dependent NAD(P)H-hydrate dehydratase / NAD(P)H-hydrate epimerase